MSDLPWDEIHELSKRVADLEKRMNHHQFSPEMVVAHRVHQSDLPTRTDDRRDKFAMAALTGYCANPAGVGTHIPVEKVWEVADAVMAARGEK